MASSTQQLFAALHALYHHEDAGVKGQAGKWLEQWQQSVEAWSISDAVLHDPNSGVEAQYFCSQTLRTKVQRDFEELPEAAVPQLRDSLLALLLKYAKSTPATRRQLCLALIALTVHVPAHKWDGGEPIKWLASRIQGQPADLALPCLLELLTLMPQEVHNFKYAVRPERRRQHAIELTSATAHAIDMLTTCLSQPLDARTRAGVLEAFGGWLRLSEGAALGPDGSRLPSHPLVVSALQGLQARGNDPTFHASVEAVCELVWCTVDPQTNQIDGNMMPLIQVLVPSVMQLRPRFAAASAQAAEEEGAETGVRVNNNLAAASRLPEYAEDDEDTAKGIARLFAEVGEAYINLIATAVQEVQAPVEAMLDVAGYPEHSIASICFIFWHKLSKHLSQGWSQSPEPPGPPNGPSGPSDSQGDVAAGERRRRREFFAPAFQRLVTLIRHRVKYPPHAGSWDKETASDFKRQRYEVADTLEDSAAVIGFEQCMSLLVGPLAELSSAVAQGQPFDWAAAEAVLFCVRAIQPHVPDIPGDPPQLMQLLAALPALPRQAPLLQACICYTIARYAGWLGTNIIAASPRDPTTRVSESDRATASASAALLPQLMQLAVEALEVAEASGAAASAILDICAYCGRHLQSCMEPLVALYHRVQRGGVGAHMTPAGDPLVQQQPPPPLAEDDVQLIMQAVCIATCKCLPSAQIPQAAATLLEPVLAAAQAATAQLPPAPSPNPAIPSTSPAQPAAGGAHSLHATHPYLAPLVDRLACLFAYVDQREAVARMLAASWQMLNELFKRCAGDARIIERGCRCLRLGVKGAARAADPLLPSLLEMLALHFKATRHSAFLYILSELAKMFGREPTHVPLLAGITASLLLDACASLRTLQEATANPDLMDDTYLLANRVVSYAPRLLLDPSVMAAPAQPSLANPAAALRPDAALGALLDSATAGVLIQHREACCSVLNFLMRLLQPSLETALPGAQALVHSTFLPRAPLLTQLLLAGAAGALPLARLVEVSQVLSALLQTWGSQAMGWMAASLGMLPDPVVSQADKEQLLGAASAAVSLHASGGGGKSDSTGPERLMEGAIDDFADLCRRNPRAQQAAQKALLPPELAAAIVL
eukprot:CAMPEP_0202382050 /NCGR_PEP_ID=MMETSP1127-20130417/40683_1 /ASSEMBLY_ACC=CAM_ASM_000462 /TAXON_ID=3047 /ORGANISM="Dunaliella tertiolecta, Strain CCMP1320" /LENGTH=1111 /DNA_ID=CAMNT_0048981157 /DNA_START=70 /DNA_END=3405 /DNA_ORIENTATION=+